MNLLWEWLADPAHWQGADGIPVRTLEHLLYSAITLVLAAVVAVPLGLWIGHTGKGRVAVVNLVNGVRSVPTLGLLFVAVLVVGPMLAGGGAHGRTPAVVDGRDQVRLIKVGQRGLMLVEIGWPASANTDRRHLGPQQTQEVVELHG